MQFIVLGFSLVHICKKSIRSIVWTCLSIIAKCLTMKREFLLSAPKMRDNSSKRLAGIGGGGGGILSLHYTCVAIKHGMPMGPYFWKAVCRYRPMLSCLWTHGGLSGADDLHMQLWYEAASENSLPRNWSHLRRVPCKPTHTAQSCATFQDVDEFVVLPLVLLLAPPPLFASKHLLRLPHSANECLAAPLRLARVEGLAGAVAL